ncbi:hypothetical protein [Candidatus Foliamicus sp.]
MREVFKHFVYVSLSLRGPDTLPGSPAMLVLCLVPWAAVKIVGNLLDLPGYPGAAVLGVALELPLLMGYAWLALQLVGKLERLPQTVVALFGAQAVIAGADLPLTYVAAGMDAPSLALQAAGLAFDAWWLVAMANILSQAVARSLFSGVLLALGHFVLYVMTYALLFEFMGVELPQA